MDQKTKCYTKLDRLSDVLALIQVLALDPDTHRSEEGLHREFQRPPNSSEKWAMLAQEHPGVPETLRE